MSAKIPADEREAIREEFIEMSERIRKKYKLTIPEAKHELREILGVSV
jgi:hypothetical protein